MTRMLILAAPLCAVLIAGPVTAAPSSEAAKTPLSMAEAETIALEAHDPTVTRFDARAAALDDRAVADSQLADPQFLFRMTNFPTDTFRLNQEAMTQIQMGLRQAFPRGKTLAFKRQRRNAEAAGARAGRQLQERRIVLNTRQAWLDLFYWHGAREKIAASRQAVAELVQVAAAVFASGRQTSQDVLRAQFELSVLDDRLIDSARQIDMAQAPFARLVGRPAAARPLDNRLPPLTIPPAEAVMRDNLVHHPSVRISDAEIRSRSRAIDIAGEQYKPGFVIDGNYGVRAGGRPDFVTLGVAVDMPFFTGKRQDRRLAATKKEREAARLDRDARLLELRRDLDRDFADWQRLDERITLYKKAVINRAAGTTEAALGAYRSGVTDFAELIRARLAELDAELTLLRLNVARLKAQARLLYLAGDDDE